MKLRIAALALLVTACTAPAPRTPPPVVDESVDAPYSEERAPAVETPATAERPRTSGAVLALLDRAETYRQAGDRENAAATLERALRIEPRNARLWNRLAAVRLDQGEAQQAEQLALKSNALAAGDAELQARNWALIAEARWSLNDAQGARGAEQRARELREQSMRR